MKFNFEKLLARNVENVLKLNDTQLHSFEFMKPKCLHRISHQQIILDLNKSQLL